MTGAINAANETIGTSEKLIKRGYTNILEFGGILDWKDKDDSLLNKMQ